MMRSTWLPLLAFLAGGLGPLGVGAPAIAARQPTLTPPATHHAPLEPKQDFRLARFRRRFYRFPRWGAPRWSTGGAARGGCLLADGDFEVPLLPLMPLIAPENQDAVFFAEALSPQPQFLAYVPQTRARQIDFLLVEMIDAETERVVYEGTRAVDGTPQIISFQPTTPLEPAKYYKWFFTTICDASDPSGNPSIVGSIQMKTDDTGFLSRIQASPPLQRSTAYAAAGAWLDYVAELAQLRCRQPGDRAVAEQWAAIFPSMALDQAPKLAAQLANTPLATAPIRCEQVLP